MDTRVISPAKHHESKRRQTLHPSRTKRSHQVLQSAKNGNLEGAMLSFISSSSSGCEFHLPQNLQVVLSRWQGG